MLRDTAPLLSKAAGASSSQLVYIFLLGIALMLKKYLR